VCFNLSLNIRREKFEKVFGVDPGREWGPGFLLSAFDYPVFPLVGVFDGRLEVREGNWGLIPPWASLDRLTTLRKSTFNARSEDSWDKPSFKQAMVGGRVLIPFSGFFEWKTLGKKKVPYFITFKDRDEVGALAGLYSKWIGPSGNWETFSLLTGPPNELMAGIHSRSPIRLEREKWATWLDPKCTKTQVEAVLINSPWVDMEFYALGDLINKKGVMRNIPEVLDPQPVDSQQTLF